MTPEPPGKRRSVIGVTAYLLLPGERRRRAAGHFTRAAVEAVRGVRALSVPARREESAMNATDADSEERPGRYGNRQRIEID